MNRITSTLILPALFLFPLSSAAAVIYVPGDQPTIQAGINTASNGDIVLVADGTYTGTGNRNLDFYGKAITVRSQNGPGGCVIDCEDAGRGFYFHSGEGANSVVLGITIRNAYTYDSGAGIYCHESSPTIRENIITDNSTYGSGHHGGGIYLLNSSAIIRDNIISLNRAERDGAGICCSDAYDWPPSFPVIKNNIITGNQYAEKGGGIYAGYFASPIILNNEISGNDAHEGGGIYAVSSFPVIEGNTISGNQATWTDGGGIYCYNTDAIISSNIITQNTSADYGAGIYYYASRNEELQVIMHNIISENTGGEYGGGIYIDYAFPEIANNLIIDNVARMGGGMYCTSCFAQVLDVRNNTFSGNTANLHGGGIYSTGSPQATILNCIIWGNTPEEIYVFTSAPAVIYSDIQGGYTGEGNMDADPLFTAGTLGDYYLSQILAGQSADSPCVDAGQPGSPRIHGTTRTDNPRDVGFMDMGYHYPLDRSFHGGVIADAGGPYSGKALTEIPFDASGSLPPWGGVITGYRWDWDGDGTWDTDWLGDPVFTHIYDACFHGLAILEVRDSFDYTSIDMAAVEILPYIGISAESTWLETFRQDTARIQEP